MNMKDHNRAIQGMHIGFYIGIGMMLWPVPKSMLAWC